MFNTSYEQKLNDKDQEEYLKQWVAKKKLKEKKKNRRKQKRKKMTCKFI